MGDPYPKPHQPGDDDGNVTTTEQNSKGSKPNNKNSDKNSKLNGKNSKQKSKGQEGKKSRGSGKKSAKTTEKKAKVAAMDSMQKVTPKQKSVFWFTSFLLEMPDILNITSPKAGVDSVITFFRDAKKTDPNPAAHSPWDFQLEDPFGTMDSVDNPRRALTHYIKNAQVATPVYDLENEFELNYRNNDPIMGYELGNGGIYGSRFQDEASNIQDPYLRRAVMTLVNSNPRSVKDLIHVTGKSFNVRFFYLKKGFLSSEWVPVQFTVSPDAVYGNIITYPDKPIYTRWYQNITGPGQAVLKRLDYVAASTWTIILDQAYKQFTSAYGKNGTGEKSISKDGDPNYFVTQLTGRCKEIENFDLAKDNDKNDKSKNNDKPTDKSDTKIINDNYDLIKLIVMLAEKPDSYTSNAVVAAKVDNLRLINEAKALFKEIEDKIDNFYAHSSKQYSRFRQQYSVSGDDQFKSLKNNLLGVVKRNEGYANTLNNMETEYSDKMAYWATIGNKATHIRANLDTVLVNNIDIEDFKELCQQYKTIYHSSSSLVTEPQGTFQRAIAKAEIIVRERGTKPKPPKHSERTYIIKDVKVVSTGEKVTKPFTDTNIDETKITFRVVYDDAEKPDQFMTMSLRSFLDNASMVQAINV